MTSNVSPAAVLRAVPADSATPVPREPSAAPTSRPDFTDLVDEWGEQSFPASDPPSNW